MPPKKDKKEAPKAKGDEAVTIILDYLRKENRPYSATDISANLHNAVTKANAAKLLKDLSDSGDLIVGIAGKQMVYHIPQDPDDFASPEELEEINIEISVLKERSTTLKSELKNLQLTLQQLRAMPTTDNLGSTVLSLNQEVADLHNRLEPLRNGTIKPISSEEKQKMQLEFKHVQGLLLERKKWFNAFWEQILDGMDDITPAQLKEKIGIDDTSDIDIEIAEEKKMVHL